MHCHNCQGLLNGPFCAACGQKAVPLDLSVRELFHDLAQEMLNVDGRLVRSIRTLLQSPGSLTAEYIRGRRASWVSPVRLYLLFSLIFFAVSMGEGGSVNIGVASARDADVIDAVRSLGYESVGELRTRVEDALHTWVPRMMFLLVPLFGSMIALAFRRTHRTYLQHLYFALHVHAAWFALAALAVAADRLPDGIASVIQVVCLGYALAYIVMAMHRAYAVKWRQAVVRAVFVLPAYGLALSIGTAVTLLPILWPIIMRQMK